MDNDQGSRALQSVLAERERQKSLSFSGQSVTEFDKQNTQADWVNYVVRYASGGAPKLEKRRDLEFRQAMVKAAALALAAIESYDQGFAQS